MTELVVYGVRLTHDITMEYRYVGITSNKARRFREHLTECSLPSDARYELPKSRWMRKHFYAIQFDILEVCTTPEELKLSEMKWVHILKSRGHRLLNLTEGGDGNFGWSPSPAWRENRSRIMTGPGNPQYGKSGKLSPNYGKKRGAEFSTKTSARQVGKGNSFYGKKHTAENMKIYVEKSSGENNASAKLNNEKVREIRRLRDNGIHAIEVAKQFDIARSTVDRIYKRKAWKHVD